MGKKSPSAPAAPDPVASARAAQLSYYGPGGESLQYGYVNPFTGQYMSEADLTAYNDNIRKNINAPQFINGEMIGTNGSTPQYRQIENPAWRAAQSGILDKNKLTSAYRAIENPYQEQTRETGQDITSSILQNLLSQGLAEVPNQIDYSQFSKVPTIEEFDGLRRNSEAEAFNRTKALLDPVFAERRKNLEQSLANRGLPTGSEVANAENDDVGRNEAAALGQASQAALEFGQNAAQQAYQNAMTSRSQSIQDIMNNIQLGTASRQNQLGELGAITGMPFAQAPNQPQYTPGVQQGFDRQYQGQLANWQQGNQNRMNLFGSLANLGLGLGTAGTGSIFGKMFGF